MTVIEILGAVASIVTIFTAGVAVGKLLASQNSKNDRQ